MQFIAPRYKKRASCAWVFLCLLFIKKCFVLRNICFKKYWCQKRQFWHFRCNHNNNNNNNNNLNHDTTITITLLCCPFCYPYCIFPTSPAVLILSICFISIVIAVTTVSICFYKYSLLPVFIVCSCLCL